MEAKRKLAQIEAPEHYSYSQISLYSDCPGAWKDAKILKLPQADSDPLIFGSTFHALTAHYDLHCLTRRTGTDYGAEDVIFEAVMREHPEANSQRAELAELFTDYVQSMIVDFEGLVSTELPLNTVINGIRFTGTLDRLFTRSSIMTVRDHKTDGRIRSQAEVDSDFQLSIYAMLVMDSYNAPAPIPVEMRFDRYGVLKRSSRDAKAIEAVRARLGAQIEGIVKAIEAVNAGETTLDEAFPYMPGSRCSICGLAQECPRLKELADLRGETVIVNAADASAARNRYVGLLARLGQVTDALKGYCSEHGNIVGNGLDLGFHKSESYTYPTLAVADILKAHKEDPLQYMNVSATAIKKLLKKDGKLKAALVRVREDASKTTFRAVKVKE